MLGKERKIQNAQLKPQKADNVWETKIGTKN